MPELEKKTVTEVKAYARGIHASPRKTRLVTDILKNLSVAEALTQLDFVQKKAALPIKKLVNSAVANAAHNFQIEADRLFIKSLTVDGGRVMMKFAPRAQGRAFRVRKRTSHINLVLGVSAKPAKPKRTAAKLPVLKKEAEPLAEKTVTETPQETSRFGFWRKKKKAEDSSQAFPPKADAKGKKYTGFDRRGNM